jgi:hypothetical protein
LRRVGRIGPRFSTTTNQWPTPLSSKRAGLQVSLTIAAHARTLTITVTETDWEKTQQRSFSQGEQAVPPLVTTIGRAVRQEVGQNKGAIEAPLEEDGQRGYRKEASLGHYPTR